MSQNWTGSTGNNTGNIKIQNFLESLRNSQMVSPSIGKSESQPRNIFAEIQAKKEIEKRRIEQFQNQRTQEWNKIFSSKEVQTEKKIEYIREQLKQLSKQLKRLDLNIVKAIQAPVVEAGEYQENYLEHLKKTIHLFSLKVNRANSWLEIYKSRSVKQGTYWGMAKTKGASFTQNNERSIATSVG
ncbi:MAG TPA: DUF5660 family protein [Spirochaetia bacterium]|nr:DUF5660 family protein [Spirochaetia bacterium]